MRTRIHTIAAVILGAACALLANGAARAQELQEEFHQTYNLAAGGSVRLKNINGGVRIVAWDQNQVKVDAVKHAWRKQRLEEARIVVESQPDNIYIWTQYPDGDQNFRSCGRFNDDDDRCRDNPASVEYTLQVPRTARLARVSAVNGSLEITGVRGEVEAEAINGHLTATGLAGGADISTVNGRLEAAFDRMPQSSVTLGSVNGSLEVTLPSDSSAQIKAHTLNGAIRNDFGLPVHHGHYVGHDLEGRLATGGPEVRLKNVNGGINIRHANDGKPVSAATSLLPPERSEER